MKLTRYFYFQIFLFHVFPVVLLWSDLIEVLILNTEMDLLGESERVPRIRVRRQTESTGQFFKSIENELEKDAEMVSEQTGMPTWSVFIMFVVIFLAVVGVVGWCAWRMLAKKRAKKDQKQQELDEQAILDMEEELDVNEEELKVWRVHFWVDVIDQYVPGSSQGVPG